ncbi:hypothetical protein A2630_01280 [Candidatus Woesebacteria bacterium RIFCSPHIGHO2_01_FULL_44_10]|uniref:TrpR like protein, YerC/YecD n=1 Tax=Candidatus Woesebacteria bacterium RIFCSPLOWO2_01_FULL_44_14 TaxID=1802525 RepID=A0A1F8C2M1_9BACT|nr:MAG: hypothetical protein A2630_01280 [Candidatus Woesebacteria bacterium RIFCSPHIGHO2_01_FULL_44_10]OGM55673.1 MAG: hypothetical protein A3F62_02520 [Candidatus Woesebacteria bacterium RIFCSPHIGHO2_12_FULL_44_11]OGM70099.1 MAG: hypothetical protein A2975_03420 [Candidatus Woesebacteria bacterium RIFCSPLOWO2_01_FULL_44_14]
MRVSQNSLNPSLKNQIIKTFAQTISDFKNISQIKTFLDDFFTPAEIETYAKRLAIAYWLKKGRSYENIKGNLKVSSATIAEVKQTMDRPGFEQAIKAIEAEEWASVWTQKIQKFARLDRK